MKLCALRAANARSSARTGTRHLRVAFSSNSKKIAPSFVDSIARMAAMAASISFGFTGRERMMYCRIGPGSLSGIGRGTLFLSDDGQFVAGRANDVLEGGHGVDERTDLILEHGKAEIEI